MAKGLAQSISNAIGKPSAFLIGIAVSNIDNYSMTANVRGTVLTLQKISSYSPIIGESVLILQYGSTNIAIGSTGNSTSAVTAQYGSVIQHGTTSISFTSQASFSNPFSFPFPFNNIPQVSTNIRSGSGTTASWNSRAINTTVSGTTAFVFGPSSSWSSVTVDWIAIGS